MTDDKSNVEVEPHSFKKKDRPIRRRIRQEHGTPILSLPKELGIKLNQEVVIEKVGTNPFGWELKIKPLEKAATS